MVCATKSFFRLSAENSLEYAQSCMHLGRQDGYMSTITGGYQLRNDVDVVSAGVYLC